MASTAKRLPFGLRIVLVVIGGLSVGAVNYAQFRIQDFNRRQGGEQDVVSGVYLPTDRSLSRAMSRARERLAAGEYHQALAFLHEILMKGEDSFLERADGEQDQAGLKATARKLIGQLPPEGHDTYELLHGATARRQLDAALESRNLDAIAAVVRQFSHTKAGNEAALLLAQMEADQGHYLAAAQLYQKLIDTPRAAERFEPQLSVMAALNHLASGKPELASETLRSMIKKYPSTTIELFGKATTVPGASADLVAWLKQLLGEPLQGRAAESNWLSIGGDPARNATNSGGRPHLRTRWQARVVNDPGIEAYLTGQSEAFTQRGVVAMPSARPIAVNDVVVMRTPQNVVAIDWHTGKRIWETRDDDELDPVELSSSLPGRIEDEKFTARNGKLEQRVWDDALVMSLASDGARVFVLRGVSASSQEEMMGFPVVGPGFRGVVGEASATTNQLAAYDLATQGKLVWELDGARSTGPLAGAFFLGPPLAVDNTLFVMAEIRSAVYLLALDPATGNIRWQQQLVGLEQGIALDPARRLIGATPSYSGGILICPTAASAVVAIDVVKREFAWVYRYPREMQSPADMRNIWQQQAQNQSVRVNDRWLDSSAVVAEGHVFITPPESAELHCLDLQTGKLLWKHRQVDSLFLGCVDDGRVLLVSADSLQALRVADHTPAWERESVSLPEGALPSGHGYLSDGSYYLPLTSGEIVGVEMATGKLTTCGASDKGAALGNLICYRGSILSQSALVLDKFEQLDAIEQRVQAALAKNADDATALRELAELKRAAGQRSEAVESLKRAYELEPHDRLTRGMLAELLLEALDADYASFRNELPLVAKLVQDRSQQVELGRIEANGFELLKKRADAWNAYVRLADITADEPSFLRIDENYSARSDRWISGRLANLWAESTSQERELFASQLAARRATLHNPQTAAELRHYLSHMGDVPGAADVRRQLARFLVDRGRFAEAEIGLLQLATSDDKQDRVVATEMMNEMAKDNEPSRAWPTGRVTAETTQTSPRVQERGPRVLTERQARFRQMRIEQDFLRGVSRMHWFVSMDCSELVGRNSLGDDVFRLPINQNSWARQNRDSNLVYGARLGHLMVVAIGGQLMTIDTRQNQAALEAEVLWQASAAGRYSVDSTPPRRTTWITQNRAGRRPVYHAWSDRKRMTGVVGAVLGSLGPVTPRGVVFQEQNELKCVDPLSGETLWTRTDVPAGCELFGDQEFVFAADVAEHQAYVVRVSDGGLIGKRELPEPEWLLTSGRNVAQLGFRAQRSDRALLLMVTDIWSEEKLFDAEYAIASRTSVVEPNAVAMCEPSGKFQLVDVASGRVIIDQQLAPVPALHSIHTLRLGDVLFLVINGQTQQQQQQYKSIGQFDFPLADGFVYAFSMKSGQPLWPGPATVRNRGIVLSQPEDIPFLVFADRKAGERSGGSALQSRLLLLDRRTGQSIYRAENLPDTSDVRFRIRGERYAEPIVSVEMGAVNIQLTMSDTPRSPQPPANDDVEATREIAERGLLGLGQRILRGATETPKPQSAEPRRQEALQPMDDD